SYIIVLHYFTTRRSSDLIRNSENKDPLIGVTASIKGTSLAATSNENGQIIIVNVPDGVQEIHFSYVGFNERIDTLEFPLKDTSRSEEHTSELQSRENLVC